MSKIVAFKKFALPYSISNPHYDRRCSIHRGNVRAVKKFPEGTVVEEIAYEYHYGPEKEYWFSLPGTKLRFRLSPFDTRNASLHSLFILASGDASGVDFEPETVEQAAASLTGGDEEVFLSAAVDELIKRGKITVSDLVKAYKETAYLVG
jgi:hypothetical protein